MTFERRPITHALQTLFADLAQQVETAPDAGTVYRRSNGGKTYLYAKLPVGAERIDAFLGRAGEPSVEQRAADLKRGMSQARERRRTVSMLRGAGLAGPDRMLGATLDAIARAGLFGRGAVLIGTGAYLPMEPHVGHRLPAATLMTGDLDLATVDLALAADPPEDMLAILRRADRSFAPVPQLDPRKPASRFRNADGYLVDLVTQTRSRNDSNPVPLDALGAGAAPLQYIAWLIERPLATVALWGAGVALTIPRPERYAVHKLILAQKRQGGGRVKRAKDLAQAGALVHALRRHDPFALDDAIDEARAMGKAGWSDPIDRSLAELAAFE